MKPLKPIILPGLAAAILFAIYSIFFPPTEKVIKNRLQKLAATISARPGGNIAKVANVNKIGAFFHPNVEISLEGFGREVASLHGRGELEQTALAARQSMGGISAQFHNIVVEAGEDKTKASATMTAMVKLNDQSDPIVQDVKLEFEKLDRAWLIVSARPR